MNTRLMIATVLLAGGIVAFGSVNTQAQDRMNHQDRMDHRDSSDKRGMLSPADKRFAMAAAHGGVAEVKLGELAARKGSSEFVRRFGQQMVDDHGKANSDLMDVAAKLNFNLPSEPNSEQRDLMDRLRRLHGAAFDSAYIRAMKMDHRMDIADFKKEANQGNGPLRRFAERTLPVVQSHYRMLEDRKMM